MFRYQAERFDLKLLGMFIKQLGIYPPGTVVQLSDGSLGLVVSPGPNSLQPTVMLYAPESSKMDAPIVDLSAEADLKIVEALSGDLQDQLAEGRLEMAESASSWLNDRLAGLRTKLEESEKALQAYRDQERLIDVKGVDSLATQELTLASERLATARRERVDKEALYRQVQQVRSSGGSLDGIPALLAYPLVAELKTAAVAAERNNADDLFPDHKRDEQFEIPAFLRRQSN